MHMINVKYTLKQLTIGFTLEPKLANLSHLTLSVNENYEPDNLGDTT